MRICPRLGWAGGTTGTLTLSAFPPPRWGTAQGQRSHPTARGPPGDFPFSSALGRPHLQLWGLHKDVEVLEQMQRKPQSWSEGWNPSGARLGELGLSSLEKRGLWDTFKPLPVPKRAPGEGDKGLECQDTGMALKRMKITLYSILQRSISK